MMPSFRDGRFHGEGGFFLVPPPSTEKVSRPYNTIQQPSTSLALSTTPHGADGDDAWSMDMDFNLGMLQTTVTADIQISLQELPAPGAWATSFMSTNGTTGFSVGGQPSPSTFKDKGFLILLSKGLQQSDAYSLQFE
ncbi:predicted protein [Coccidioides posadasii str. Silveira]|uniref:Predicted protein n=1 Tax=Coccidioides posadasii (strain RMSCC 757 / Silveira) TaxID=443226 RepID=E9D9D3_COCPS|nr:predicted protein [Coccidioides posadasii str. Silveira]